METNKNLDDIGLNGGKEIEPTTKSSVVSTDPLSDFLDSSKETAKLSSTGGSLLDFDIPTKTTDINEFASNEMKNFLDDNQTFGISGPGAGGADFKFEKPLPAEPKESTADFLLSEANFKTDVDVDDKMVDDIKTGAPPSISPTRDFDTPSPVPPPVPKHQESSSLKLDDSPNLSRGESPLLKMDDQKDDLSRGTPSPAPRQESPVKEIKRDSPVKEFKRQESPLPPTPHPEASAPPLPTKVQEIRDESPERYEPTQTPEPDFTSFKPVADFDDDEKFVESFEPTPAPVPVVPKTTPQPTTPAVKKEKIIDVIGPKDIRAKIVESLVYWRDPKKSGVVFGVTMLTLLSLTMFSLISVVAYLCLFTVVCTISFRIYKSIMQAVQKTSDGHPFKEFLDLDLTIPEDKVKELSLSLVQYINTSVATLRSLFLVEDIIDSIKFTIILWILTYVGACFNGLTLIIIGVVLLFSLPKVYENNKAQIDAHIKIAMDKLSIITNKVKTIVPDSKKESEKPKDQ